MNVADAVRLPRRQFDRCLSEQLRSSHHRAPGSTQSPPTAWTLELYCYGLPRLALTTILHLVPLCRMHGALQPCMYVTVFCLHTGARTYTYFKCNFLKKDKCKQLKCFKAEYFLHSSIFEGKDGFTQHTEYSSGQQTAL